MTEQDRTDRAAWEALRESEERLRTLSDNLPHGAVYQIVAEAPDRRRFLYISAGVERLLGVPPTAVLADAGALYGLVHADDRDRLAAAEMAAGLNLTPFDCEFRSWTRGGDVRWLHTRSAPRRLPTGEIIWEGVLLDVTEWRRAERELRASRERLDLVVNSVDVGLWYCDLPFDRLVWNARVKEHFGLPADADVTIDTFYERLHPEDRERTRQAIERSIQDRAGYDIEYRTVDLDGRERWVRAMGRAFYDPSGRPVRFDGITMDVTDRVIAAEQLRRRAEEVERLMDVLPLGVFIAHDPQCRRITANRAGYEMMRMPPGSNLSLTSPPGEEPPFAAFRDGRPLAPDELPVQYAAAHAAEVRDVEVEHVYPDGAAYTLFGSASPLFDARGEVRGCVASFLDITERKRAERTIASLLHISERLNASLDVDTLLDILVQEAIRLVNAEGGVAGLHTPQGMVSHRYHQRGTTMLLEYCWPPMHGLPGWLIVHKTPYLTNDAQTDPQIVPQLCARFGVRSALATPILNARGEVLGFFEVHNKRAISGFGPADREMLVAVSQTAAIAIQNALAYREVQRAEAALKEADRRKDEFLATLAHELRNPLAPIRNGLHLLRLPGVDRSAAEQAHGMMERQLAQLVRLIDDLLDVSRITCGKLELRTERVDLAAVVRSAIEASHPQIEASAHRLTVALPPEPVWLDADPARLAQVLGNLLTNAAKYTDRGGHIRLAAERHGGEVVVSVTDTGIGIAAEHLPRLFEMFAQVHSALERSQGGLGIGLSLVKGLVEMHGGRVEARSEGPGQGSEFIVRLPVAGGPAIRPGRASAEDAAPGARPRLRILVADDNRDAANSLALMLRWGGHDVHVAHDGQEATEAAGWFRPDLALLDIGMPRLNGYETARRIREQPWGQAVLLAALTGWGQAEDRRRAAEAGFDIHLTKPVAPADLERLLDAAGERASGKGTGP